MEETMPVEVSEVEKLREYLRGVLGAAQHHANNVDQIVLALAGAVIARKDNSPLQVRAGKTKEMGNALTFTSARGNTYALSYNHSTRQIDLKQGNSHGPVTHSFDNLTPIAQVATIFAQL
jgi:integron cassette protein